VLTEPKSLSDIPFIKQQVQALGYLAMTKEEFIKKNTRYYITKTGFGTNVLIMTLISFVVGLSIAGQTFYTFVLENLEKFGALKAIGAKKSDIMHIILFQAAVVGFLGYGIGTLLSSVVIALAKLRLPNYASTVTLATLFFSFVMVIIIVAFSSYIGVKKAIRVDPFEIFRG
jgi:putative ABC transport system permease protein